MSVARWLHLLGVVVWVGGMFFAHFALRPAVQSLPPPQRLPLLVGTLQRFLLWAGISAAAILLSGFAMVALLGGFGAVGHYVYTMMAIGIVMMLIYGHIVAGPFRRMSGAVAAGDWERAGAAMAGVRKSVGINLVLGLVTMTVAILGRG